MNHTYKQIGWGLWLSGEDKYLGHPNRDESFQIFYSLDNNFRGLGVDDVGIFEFDGMMKPNEINFKKIYRENSASDAIKGKINYNGERFDRKVPAGYKGIWRAGKKSGLFTFISGDLYSTTPPSSLNLIQHTMLVMTQKRLEKLHAKFENHLEAFPFAL